jgi:hypothetical protein
MHKRSSGERGRNAAARATSPSVGSVAAAAVTGIRRCPPSRRAGVDTDKPATAKNATDTAVYHTAKDESRRTRMEPEDIPAAAAAALPEAAPAPAVLDGLVLYDPPALTAQLATYSEARDLFIRWLFDHLVAGIDYMLIHRKVGPRGQKTDCPERADAGSSSCKTCGGKATLCKPGSEKMCGLLQLRPRFRRDVESWEMLGGEPGLVTLVCELTTATGTIVAEGRGARHRDQDFGDVNKTLKMAQKSAQTDAVLRCAGLSEIFTQDLEDMPASARDAADEPAPFEAPRRAKEEAPPAPARRRPAAEPLQRTLERSVDAAAAARRTQEADDEEAPRDALSKPRLGRLFALLHAEITEADIPDEEHDTMFNRAREYLRAWVATETGRSRLAYCSWKHYDDLCAQIPTAVEAALRGDARPQPRLVRRRTYSAPRRPLH